MVNNVRKFNVEVVGPEFRTAVATLRHFVAAHSLGCGEQVRIEKTSLCLPIVSTEECQMIPLLHRWYSSSCP